MGYDHKKFIIEVLDEKGMLDFEREKEVKKAHPYLFSKPHFNIDDLCYFVSYGEDRNNPSGPKEFGEWMAKEKISWREKTW